MDMDESWNPEPPPEIMKINKEDLIGDTLFSKHWLFEVLLKLIKKVEEDASSSEPKDEGEAAANYEELDPDFEKDLCDLWDMSVQKDVVLVLDEFNAIQIFEGFLLKFNDKYPRAIEILIGILVNMATLSSEIALKLINNQWLMHFLLFEIMVKMADVPSVIQVVFLLTVFTRTETRIQAAFFEAFKTELSAKEVEQPGPGGNVGLLQTFYFILEQSLNSTLLDSTCNLIVQLIDNDEQLLDAFSSDARIVDSVCAAVQTRFELERSQRTQPILETPSTVRPSNLNRDEPVNKLNTQTSQEDISTIDHVFNKYFLCLQTLSTCERGAECLVSRADVVLVRTFDVYLENCLGTFNEWEIKSSHSLKSSVVAESLQNLVCLISLLNCLIPDQLDDTQARLVDLNLKYPTFFEKLFHLCKYYLIMFSEVKQIDSQESQNANNNNNNSATQSNSNTDDVDSNSQFNMAHASLKDLLRNVLILKKQNNPKLSRLIDECISLSDDVEHQ